MIPVLSVLCIVQASNLGELVSDALGVDRSLHRFAGMTIGSVSQQSRGWGRGNGLEADGAGYEAGSSGVELEWNGFRLEAREDFRASLDGREGAARHLWIQGRCGSHDVQIPSGPVRWQDGRLVDSLVFAAPPRCGIAIPYPEVPPETHPRLFADTLVFDANGLARVGGAVLVQWKVALNWLGSVDTVLAPSRFGTGSTLSDTLRLRPDAGRPAFRSRGLSLYRGHLVAEGFQGWPDHPVPTVDRLEIDRSGTPWNAEPGTLSAHPLGSGRFLVWKGGVGVRNGSLVPTDASGFGLVETDLDDRMGGSPLDSLGRTGFQPDTIALERVGDTLVATREVIRSWMDDIVVRARFKVPLAYKTETGSGKNPVDWEADPVGLAGLTDTSGRLVAWRSWDRSEGPTLRPGTGLVLHLDPGIEISYRVGSSGDPRRATRAKGRVGAWGEAEIAIESPYDPQANSYSGSRTPIGSLRIALMSPPPASDFRFPNLAAWGVFVPGRGVRYLGRRNRVQVEGSFLPNPAWRKIVGRDTLPALVAVAVERDPRGDLRVVPGGGDLLVFLPRGYFPSPGAQPIGIGQPHQLVVDSDGTGKVVSSWFSNECAGADTLGCEVASGWWKMADSPRIGGRIPGRAIYEGGRFTVDPSGKATEWEAWWSGFSGADSLAAPDGSTIAGSRRIELSWKETEKGVTQWTARSPGLARRAPGGREWDKPQGDTDLVWVEGKGFAGVFAPFSHGGFYRGTWDSLDVPKKIGKLSVDRAPATVGAYRRCVDAGKCPPLVPVRDGNHPAEAYDATLESWAETRVENVGFAQAKAFCRFRSGRLPTRAEWIDLGSSDCYPFETPGNCAARPSTHPEAVAQGMSHINGLHDLVGRGPVWCADGRPCPREERRGKAGSEPDGPSKTGAVGIQCVADIPGAPTQDEP